MLITNSSNYNYQQYNQYKQYNKDRAPVDPLSSTPSTTQSNDSLKKESVPNDIIKVDSQSYVVKSYKTYNKHGKIVVY